MSLTSYGLRPVYTAPCARRQRRGEILHGFGPIVTDLIVHGEQRRPEDARVATVNTKTISRAAETLRLH